MQVFLIRHPRPLIEPGICYGRCDVDAELPGVAAARIRPHLPAGIPVFSSPLRRARQLAEALDPVVRIDDRLSEIDFGEWEGRPWSRIDRQALDAWAADVLNFVPPGGESVAQLRDRAVSFAASLSGEHVAIVAHAGILRALVGHWLDLPVAEWTQMKFDFGSITTLRV